MTKSAVVPIRPSDLAGDQIPDELRTKIGELVSRWAYIEYQLKVVIRVSLGITRAVQNLLLHRRDLRNLCELLGEISKADSLWVPDASLRAELKSLSTRVAKASERRNDFAHGIFAIPKKGEHAGKLSRYLYQKLEHKIEPGWEPTEAMDLEPLISEATHLGVRAQNATVLVKKLKGKK